MKNKTIVIDRREWLRGTANGLLRNTSGKMCCLGFAAHQISGCTLESLIGTGMPADIGSPVQGLNKDSEWGIGMINTQFSEDAQEVNDNCFLTDRQRETQLRKLARKNGFIFKFIN